MENSIEIKIDEYIPMLEAILFACGEPIEKSVLMAVLEVDGVFFESLIDEFDKRLTSSVRGLQLINLGDRYRLVTKLQYDDKIKQAIDNRAKRPISKSAMEVLSIVAYNQPCTRGYIDSIRGVDSSYHIKSLLEKGLLEENGRLELPGRPMGYKTTDLFLLSFNIGSIEELPPLPDTVDIEKILQDEETQLEVLID